MPGMNIFRNMGMGRMGGMPGFNDDFFGGGNPFGGQMGMMSQ